MEKYFSLKIFATAILFAVSSIANAQSYMSTSDFSWNKNNFPRLHFDKSVDTQVQKYSFDKCPDFNIKFDKSIKTSKPNFDINLDEMMVDPILTSLLGPSNRDIDNAYDNSTHIIAPGCIGKMKMSQIETPKWAAKQYSGSQF